MNLYYRNNWRHDSTVSSSQPEKTKPTPEENVSVFKMDNLTPEDIPAFIGKKANNINHNVKKHVGRCSMLGRKGTNYR